MNVYFVVSEELEAVGGGWYEPPQSYRIAKVVRARSGSQARYLAWRSDKVSVCDRYMRGMPRFNVRLLGHEDSESAKVLSDKSRWWNRVGRLGVLPVETS